MTMRMPPHVPAAPAAHCDCGPAQVAAPPAVTAGWQDSTGSWYGANLSLLKTRTGLLMIDVFVMDQRGRPTLLGRIGLDPPRAQLLAEALLRPTPTGEEIWGETPEADLFPLDLPGAGT